jgi:hypothetical protein
MYKADAEEHCFERTEIIMAVHTAGNQHNLWYSKGLRSHRATVLTDSASPYVAATSSRQVHYRVLRDIQTTFTHSSNATFLFQRSDECAPRGWKPCAYSSRYVCSANQHPSRNPTRRTCVTPTNDCLYEYTGAVHTWRRVRFCVHY